MSKAIEHVERVLEKNIADVLKNGPGIVARPTAVAAVCPSGAHVLRAGLGGLGIGFMWDALRDADRGRWNEHSKTIPVVRCTLGLVNPCLPQDTWPIYLDGPNLLLENAMAESRMSAIIQVGGVSGEREDEILAGIGILKFLKMMNMRRTESTLSEEGYQGQLPTYHYLLDHLCRELEVPGAVTFDEAVRYVKGRMRELGHHFIRP